MIKKRIRNRKIEKETRYKVILESELDNNYTDYTNIIHTGMEIEEEKEIQIKNIMNGNKIEITVPKILDSNINKKYGVYKQPKEYIKFERDVENLYLFDSEDESFFKGIFKNEPSDLGFKSENNIIIDGNKKDDSVSRDKIDIKSTEDLNKNNQDLLFFKGFNLFNEISNVLNKRNLSETIKIFENRYKECINEECELNNELKVDELKVDESINGEGTINEDINNDNPVSNSDSKDNNLNDNICIKDKYLLIDYKHICNYIQKKILKLHDENDLNPYLCFRKRIIKSGRKLRRNETICIEKLKRMYNEFLILKKITELKNKKNKKEIKLIEIEMKIINILKNENFNKKKYIRKLIYKDIKNKPFYKIYNIKNLMNDESQLIALRRVLSCVDFSIDESLVEKEVDFLNYLDTIDEDLL